ncbi:hypothetical protein [Haloferula sargassicola]|uniref:Small CPxCG-related zinc finger protein n=1 Tax=Haloferula sargassicola TaxID=490096 RepID=A0ABP9UJ58_9BACT
MTTTEETPRCDRCGAPTELQFGERWICEDCYVSGGACCAGEDEG